MTITVNALRTAVRRASGRMGTLEDELNAADARLGDGDTGAMLARLVAAFSAVELDDTADLGAAFMALAKAGAASTGSSLGTLIVTAMMTLGKATKGDSSIEWKRLGPLLKEVRNAVMARGKSELGAKTIIDALDHLARGIDGVADAQAVATAAVAALDTALSIFRPLPCAIGRARMFAERSIGLDDPGMLALAEITRAVASTDGQARRRHD